MLGAACVGAPAQTSLAPVTVTATRFSTAAADLPFGVSVLTADAIKASGATTVNEAIMKLLGVPGRLDPYGGGDYGLDLRGFGSTADNNQVVIVDGIRINEADLGGTRLAGIAIDSVERIEVIRGSAAVLYGEGATGGAIVITTKAGQGTLRQNRADVYGAAGSFGLRELRASATLATGGLSMDVAANKRDADNHRDNFRSKIDGASLTGQWRNEWLRIGARYARDRLDTGLPGSLTAAQYAADPRQATTPFDSATIRNERSAVFSQASLGDWQLVFDAGRRTKALSSMLSGFAYATDTAATQYALSARHDAKLAQIANALVLGADDGDWTRKVLGAFGSEAHQRSHALYAKDELTLAGGTRLSAGWRSERIDKDNTDAAGSVHETQRAWEAGVVQPLAPDVAIYARIGRSFRLPNVDEFGFTSPGVTLRAQTARDTELGARWRFKSGRAELRAYRSTLTDEIGFDPNAPGPFGPGANVNFDPTRRQGLELEVSHAVAANIDLRLNAAARQARFTAGPYDGKNVPLTPKRSLSLRADWRPAVGHKLDAGVNVVSSQSPDFANVCTMPSYTTADLRYAYQWRTAEIALGVSNLTDRKYYTQAFRCVNGETSAIYPEAGRAFTASARVSF